MGISAEREGLLQIGAGLVRWKFVVTGVWTYDVSSSQ